MLLELLCLSGATTLCESPGSFVGYRVRGSTWILVDPQLLGIGVLHEPVRSAHKHLPPVARSTPLRSRKAAGVKVAREE
jgi:hypothetical protein